MSDTFCVLPWFGKELNWEDYNTHCCLLPTGYNVEKIKKEMLSGKKPTECNKCWHLESNGITSDRQLKNSTLDWVLDKDLELIKNDAEKGNTETIMLKLITSYTCNAMCVSCGPRSSSSWYQLEKKMFDIVPERKYKFIDIEAVKQQINFKNLKMLSLIGGEPLYEKKNFDLLEYMLDIGNDKVFLSMVTNGSVSLTDHQKRILSKFKNVNFSVSIDGTEQVFEYVRYPLKWSDLTNNLTFFREITDNVSSNYTISNLNVIYHNETVNWFNKEKIIFSNNIVYNPAWLHPKVLPLNVKEYLKNTLSDVDYRTLIGNDNQESQQDKFERFKVEIKKQDTAKGINLKNYLPKLAEMINWS
jgi:hypothetical protein